MHIPAYLLIFNKRWPLVLFNSRHWMSGCLLCQWDACLSGYYNKAGRLGIHGWFQLLNCSSHRSGKPEVTPCSFSFSVSLYLTVHLILLLLLSKYFLNQDLCYLCLSSLLLPWYPYPTSEYLPNIFSALPLCIIFHTWHLFRQIHL